MLLHPSHSSSILICCTNIMYSLILSRTNIQWIWPCLCSTVRSTNEIPPASVSLLLLSTAVLACPLRRGGFRGRLAIASLESAAHCVFCLPLCPCLHPSLVSVFNVFISFLFPSLLHFSHATDALSPEDVKLAVLCNQFDFPGYGICLLFTFCATFTVFSVVIKWPFCNHP